MAINETIRPNGNVNQLWNVYDYTKIIDSNDLTYAMADDDNELVEQIWSFDNPAFTFETLVSVEVFVKHKDAGISGNPDASVNVKIGGSWYTGQNISYNGTYSVVSVSWDGVWSNSDFNDFQVGITAPDISNKNREYKVAEVYAVISVAEAGYSQITINNQKSDSPNQPEFEKSEGESFEIELYHNGIDLGTTIDFTIAASPNDSILGNGGFTLDDIASVTVGSTTYEVVEGVLAGQTSVVDGVKTEKIVITLAEDSISENTEYFRLTFATTDSAGNPTTLSSTQESWNPSNLAQTWDMLITNVVPSDVVSVVATQNGTEAGTPVQFTFTRTGDTSSSLNVSYRMFGTAVAGTDYTGSQTGTVTFGAGVSSVVLSLPTIEDSVINPVKIVGVYIDKLSTYDITPAKQFAEATIVGDGIVSSEIQTSTVPIPRNGSNFTNTNNFMALRTDGSVVNVMSVMSTDDAPPVGLDNVSQVFSNDIAFAALKEDGSVVTWGHPTAGGDSSGVAAQLSSGVVQIFSTISAFAALKDNGSVVVWGDATRGGSNNTGVDLSSGVVKIFSNYGAFAALKTNGSVVTWGDSSAGGNGASELSGITDIIDICSTYDSSTKGAFAALRATGEVITWGCVGCSAPQVGNDSSGVQAELVNVVKIFATRNAFAALKSDGSVVTWGGNYGENSGAVAADLSSGVTWISAQWHSFAALKEDGTVVHWGSGGEDGGTDWDDVKSDLTNPATANVIQIYDNVWAFAALKSDGSVVTWGTETNRPNGSNSNSVSADLSSGVKRVYRTDYAFAALKTDGSVVVWGDSAYGGTNNTGVDLSKDIVRVFANRRNFTALKRDGSVVTWGKDNLGINNNVTNVRTFSNIETLDTLDPVALNDNPPTLNAIDDITIDEDAPEQTVNLTGIGDGDSGTQPLQITVSSSNPTLIPTPTVTYTSDNVFGSLTFTPAPGLSGESTITVTVTDGGLDNDLSTTTDNKTFSREFTVGVDSVNDPPTLNTIGDITIEKNSGPHTVSLAGITDGDDDTQALTVTAVSSATGTIPNPTVTYTSNNTTGSLTFTPVTDQTGTATITVTVQDSAGGTVARTFTITVIDVNNPPTLDAISNVTIEENDPEQTVNLTGITDGDGVSAPLKVTATSSNTSIIPNPVIAYTSAQTTGTLKFTPIQNRFTPVGQPVTITVTVEDAGLDNDLSTTSDNLTFSRTFTVTVNEYIPPRYYVIDIELVSHPGNQSILLNNGFSAEVCHITEYANPVAEYVRGFGHTLDNPLVASGDTSIKSRLTGVLVASGDFLSSGAIPNSGLFVTHGPSKHIDGSGSLQATYTDKLAGDFGDYRCAEKLYPIADISNSYFVTSSGTHSDLYSSIDEGVFSGDGIKENGVSTLIADSTTFIQPSSIHTDDTFSYKCKVTTPLVRPEHTRLRIRAAAPLFTHEAKIPPKYTFTDIKFEDPDGALIVQYNDIVVSGDSTYISMSGDENFATYSSAPKVNNITYSWDDTYPNLSGNEYTLSFNLLSEDPGDAFSAGFDPGFEEDYDVPDPLHSGDDYLALDGSPLSSMGQSYINPTPSIRISAIEICNSGGRGPRTEDYITLFSEVRSTGNKVQRTLIPTSMPLVDFDTTIYPTVSSVWYASDDANFSNYNTVGTKRLIHNINNSFDSDFIIMNHTSGVADSGKLTLKMSHNADPNNLKTRTRGAFDLGFDGTIGGTCIRNGAFNKLNIEDDDINDGFFVADRDCITLRVRAKKQSGSRDYVLDVVGYSDDCILNITSAVGGFLQASSGNPIGNYPVSSGFSGSDDLALSATSLSQRENYFQVSGDNSHFVNLGEDHYSLVDGPLVNTTEFAWYEIPLKIYDDNVTLGRSRDYRMSSLLENLYLDIYPLPSGASISQVEMLVTYAPQNALKMITEGGEVRKVTSEDRPEPKIFPSSMQPNDSYLNAGSGYGSLSYISGIPQAYSTKNTSLKTNYSRRWRGMDGLTEGPYDQEAFGFGFYNPQLDYPFLSGFYDFDKENGVSVIPRVGNLTGVISSTYSTYRINNLGWRFKNSTLFADQLPGYTGAYETIDWSSLSNGSNNFHNHPLSGQIADAFNTAIRISGHNSNINFGDINIVPDSGFSMYARFSPDANVSGVGYDLFESGCLFSKWDTGNDLEFALGYASGFLRGYARDNAGAIHTVQDPAICSGYQYPLSVILTYNDDGLSGLKLYTDNEFEPNWQTLRASSVAPFHLHSANSNFVVGNSTGSGVGFNMFLTELGVSNSGNVVYSNPDPTYKQITAQRFLENNRLFWWDNTDTSSNDGYTLWKNIDEDTRTDWTLGDFKYEPFSLAFSQISKRTNRDLVSFKVCSDGQPYYAKTNQTLPSTIDSGVAYHSQIENDFLRFHLSDTPNNFYSVYPRISKSLPRGYNFVDDALVVETVLEHTTNHDITWSGGQVGPKLIVSLYTKKQEPYYETANPNWGLINRSTHYLEPSGGIHRLDSTFTYDDVCDKSEEWATFPIEAKLKEFKEKYFSQDVDDMFLQYDVVYPSGGSFESTIDIHTAHVRMENAYVNPTADSGILNIATSGGHVVDDRDLMLSLYNGPSPTSGELTLYTIGPIQVENSGLPLHTSGLFASRGEFNLFTTNFMTIEQSGLTLSTSGKMPIEQSGAVNLHTLGKGILTSASGDHLGFSLTAVNTETAGLISGIFNLNAFVSPTADTDAIQANMPIFVLNDFQTDPTDNSGILNLRTLATSALVSIYPTASMNLYLETGYASTNADMNLTLYGDNYSTTASSGSMNLSTANYAGPSNPLSTYNYASAGSDYLYWFNNNVGTGINVFDNSYATLPADDELRGVDLIGYGSCIGNSPDKAIDAVIETDDVVWREEQCVEGGIMRADKTYTNLEAGYSGNYYGIRKYTELVPSYSYFATLEMKTGNTESIKVPRDLEEWEYGINSDINYSGVKLIGDDPALSGDASIEYPLPDSGRNPEDNYGKSVAVHKDLMVVGSPFIDIPDESGYKMTNAGAAFVYRRNEDAPGQKADWKLATHLILPSGFKRDFVSREIPNAISFGSWNIDAKKWNVGQEGRELGHSVDIASSGDTETIVIGAPGAGWTRQFDTITESGIPVCMMVFTDQFNYQDEDLGVIANTAEKNKILYRYFSAPWLEGFQPRIDIKLLVFQAARHVDNKPVVYSDLEWFNHQYIERENDPDLLEQTSKEVIINGNVSGIQDAFLEMFPHDTTSPHSGIPPIVGIFKDNTASTKYTDAFKESVDRFISYYNDYSFVSGVNDPSNASPQAGHVNEIDGNPNTANFLTDSVKLLDDTLATGYLNSQNVLKFITSGVGQEWANSNAYQFQIPPASGGRVYIFEKENNEFNLVQEIKSKTERDFTSTFSNNGIDDYAINLGSIPSTRFGHSVSISDENEIITVGSPYDANAVEVFERNPSEHTRMLNNIRPWLVHQDKTEEVTKYDLLLTASGTTQTAQQIYYDLSTSDKFLLRIDESYWINRPIELYKNIYTYGYGNIPYRGTWSFIPDEFAGTSRLGYSTAVSSSGKTIAVGAPTDSFNEFDDNNVWYRSQNTWASYTNAGAVRVFESRNYYPHNRVVEFYKFGNLDRTMHPSVVDQGFYDQWDLFYGSERPFTRTAFSDIEIPQDAGLAFIITPEVDAASDEIIQNIKDWLALGDRTLVLVGNDPSYEENGLYRDSNVILNKILEKLGSRMSIHPARNAHEALVGARNESQVFDKKYNVVASKVPSYATSTRISNASIFASGVGDIRINVSDDLGPNYLAFTPCNDFNAGCGLPHMHNGDLRAEWTEVCTKTIPGVGAFDVYYKNNWPLQFGNFEPDCDYPPRGSIRRPNQDIRPILVAAEDVPERTYTIPAVPPASSLMSEPIYADLEENTTYLQREFAEQQIDEVAFSIYEDDNSNFAGVNINQYSRGTFDDPDSFTTADGSTRDGLIYATGVNQATPPISQTEVLAEETIAITKEQYFDDENNPTIHSVYLMANMSLESSVALGVNNVDTPNSDQNILFYNNLIMKDCINAGQVYQLGGWTGRSSFTSAYSQSAITQAWSEYQGLESYRENVILGSNSEAGEIQEIPDDVNVLWIANPQGLPTEADLNAIKSWLHAEPQNLGDTENPNLVEKKIVITYGANQEIASNVRSICESLNLTTKPRRSENPYGPQVYFGGFFLRSAHGLNNGVYQHQNVGLDISTIGCTEGYVFASITNATEVDGGLFIPLPSINHVSLPDVADPTNFVYSSFFSIELGSNTTKLLYFDGPPDQIVEDILIASPDSWYVPGNNASATFNVEKGSGYRLFINRVSENTNEQLSLSYSTNNVAFPGGGDWFLEQDEDDPTIFSDQVFVPPGDFYHEHRLSSTTNHNIETLQLDFYVPSGDTLGTTTFKLNFKTPQNTAGPSQIGGGLIEPDTSFHDYLLDNNTFPATTRLLSISGCLLPVNNSSFTTTETTQVQVGERFYWRITNQGSPERIVTLPATFRPIMTDNTKYCDPGNNPTGAGDTDPDQEIFNTLDGESDKECLGGSEIEDGPMVCAVERENFSGFVNGLNKSTIVVISDSTIVQGQNAYYRNDTNAGNQAFMRSLYPVSPGDPDDDGNFFTEGRNYSQVQKLLSPERGSPGKYLALSSIDNTTLKFGDSNYSTPSVNVFSDTENSLHPNDIFREPDPDTGEEIKEAIDIFETGIIKNYGAYPRYSGVINGVDYMDARRGGGVPDLLKKTGKDYLDLDVYSTGYPGDLFGYDISMYEDKLVVGSPFNAFTSGHPAISWPSVLNHYNSGIDPAKISGNGGVGAVFYFERTEKASNVVGSFLPWEYKDKIKAGCLSLGFDNPTVDNLSDHKGDHNVLPADVIAHAHRNDEFGRSVAITSDMLAVGAPCHDFETIHQHVFYSDTAFIRKDFNAEFKIHEHNSWDLGCSGNRVDLFEGDSGKMVLNNGAVFTFKHRITDWPNRIKTWEEADKINAQGYSDRNTDLIDAASSGTENDYFGTSVALHRAKRGDSDYTLVVGSPNHNYSTSGNHITSENMENAGAAYTFDAMLREQLPTIPNSNSFMTARVFGDREADHLNTLTLNVSQNTTGDPITYTTSGIVNSNSKGHIFLEASGYDASTKGFAIQRPYVVSVRGNLLPGTPDSGSFTLFTTGKPVDMSGNMNLMLSGAPSANVYNNMALYNRGVLGLDSGNLQMFLKTVSGVEQEQVTLYVENEILTENLNLRVRGK
jgi:alpha-tubulin suppressor-like RCC1 family protein